MLQNANNYAQQSVILQQFLPRLRTDVSHEGQDLEDLLFDFNVDIGRHEHSEQWFDVVCDCRRQILVSFINESPQQLDRSLDFFHFVLKYRVVDLIQNLLDAGQQVRSEALQRNWCDLRLSKYNGALESPCPNQPFVLVVDQTAGDLSIQHGSAEDKHGWNKRVI